MGHILYTHVLLAEGNAANGVIIMLSADRPMGVSRLEGLPVN